MSTEGYKWLFDKERRAMARKSDPTPSHAAADEIESSGKAASHREKILIAIYFHPACNARELAVHSGLEYAAMSKRLSELSIGGLIEPADNASRRGRRWFVTEKGMEVLGC